MTEGYDGYCLHIPFLFIYWLPCASFLGVLDNNHHIPPRFALILRFLRHLRTAPRGVKGRREGDHVDREVRDEVTRDASLHSISVPIERRM